jgi:hypothetical protein
VGGKFNSNENSSRLLDLTQENMAKATIISIKNRKNGGIAPPFLSL